MTGWEPNSYNPLTSPPKQDRPLQDKPEPVESESAVTINGQSVALPWPFLVGDADSNFPTVDILTSD